MVRRGASQALSVLSDKVAAEHVSEFLLTHLELLLDDSNDSVKVYALSSAIPLAERLDRERVQAQILPALKAASANKQSWRLRFAAAESGAFIAKFCFQAVVDTKIVPMYVSLLGDSEAEVRSEASGKLVELTSHCSSNLILTRVLPQLKL